MNPAAQNDYSPRTSCTDVASGSAANSTGFWDGHDHHLAVTSLLAGREPLTSTCWAEEGGGGGEVVVHAWQRGGGGGDSDSGPKIEVPSVERILQHVEQLRRMRQSEGLLVANANTAMQAVDNRRTNTLQQMEPVYDVPRSLRIVDNPSVQPAQLVLRASKNLLDCDRDSLEDEDEEEEDPQQLGPDIPSPDYGSEEDDAAYGVYEDYPSEFSDSGLGESDGRSTYYLDDQGLEVIMEEEEEDYVSEPSEEEEEEDDEEEEEEEEASSLEQAEDEVPRSSDDVNSQKSSNVDASENASNEQSSSMVSHQDKYDFPDSTVETAKSRGVDETPTKHKMSDDNFNLLVNNNNTNSEIRPMSSPETDSRKVIYQAAEPSGLPDTLDHDDANADQPAPEKVENLNTIESVTQWTFAELKLQNGHVQNGIVEGNSVNGVKPPTSIAEANAENGQECYKSTLPSVRLLRSCFESKSNENGVPAPRNFSTLPARTKKQTSHKPLSNGDCAVRPEKPNSLSQTLPVRRSRSVIGQNEKTIPELIHSLESNKLSNTLPKPSSKPRSYISAQNQSVRTAKPIFSPDPPVSPEDVIPSIIAQFASASQRACSSRSVSLQKWDPTPLLKELYEMQSPLPTYSADATSTFINIEGYLDKLPSGRKKATFWNAWKRRYFKLKDGYLFYYQNQHAEKPSLTLNLMGGHIDSMDTTMLGIDDAKGHYVVIRCSNRQEMEQWKAALQTHTAENFNLTYIQPVPAYPHFYEDVLILDLGSCSTRAGILCNQATLPQLFFPSVYSMDRKSGEFLFGIDALASPSIPIFPFRPSPKIVKHSVDMEAIEAMFAKIFSELNIPPREFQVQLCLPSSFMVRTQTDVLRILFEKFEVKSVNLTPQTVLSLLSYNSTSGIVVDIGERLDVIPIIDGYVVEPGVARIPYGGGRIAEHLRHFLLRRNYDLVSDIDTYLVRYVLEQLCYCPEKYNEELQRFHTDPESFERSVDLKPFFPEPPWDAITLDSGAFQATEGLFNPDAWGLDNPGVHKLVHRAIQECSLDIRKEMTRSIYLSGGLTLLPGFASRLELEVDKLTPPSLSPKVHNSPYRYHAAYLGACVLAGSPGFQEAKITREDWVENGPNCLRKWHL